MKISYISEATDTLMATDGGFYGRSTDIFPNYGDATWHSYSSNSATTCDESESADLEAAYQEHILFSQDEVAP